MNAPLGATGGTPETAAAYVNGLGLVSPGGIPLPAMDPSVLAQAAKSVGEESIISRTGGAPTLAFGMSHIMSFVGGDSMKSFWYHFAVMFEALFILTTVDAGTRVARFMFSDAIAQAGAKKFKDPSWRIGAWVSTFLVVAGWGSILIMGVNDPLGGIYTLFPLFGIANQLLAAIALLVLTVILVKRGQGKWAWVPGVPLAWDLLVTMTASWQKIFSSNPKIGFFAQHNVFVEAKAAGKVLAPAKTPAAMDQVIFNTMVQGTLSILYAVLVIIVVISGLVVIFKARGKTVGDTEVSAPDSKIFAPRSFVPTAAEAEVLVEWKDAGLDPSPAASREKVGAH